MQIPPQYASGFLIPEEKNIPELKTPSGKEHIRITEWGPYNFAYPFIFLKKIDSNAVYHFDVMGPEGNWAIKNTTDVSEISKTSGSFPAEITAKKNGDDVQIIMTYSGPAFKDQFGKWQSSSNPFSFSYRDYQPEIDWEVKWFSWDANHDPNKNYSSFKDLITTSTPFKLEHTKRINYTW